MEETPYLQSNEAIRQKFKHLPLIGSLSENDQLALLHASRVRRFDAFYALIYRMVAELLSARLRASNDKVVALQQELEALKAAKGAAQAR